MGALCQPGLSRLFTTIPLDCAGAIVQFRFVSAVTVGTQLHVNLLAVSLLVWKYFRTPRQGSPPPSGKLPRLLPAGWSHDATLPLCSQLLHRSHQMASYHLTSLARGTSGTVPISLKKGNIVAPRIPIGPAYAQSVKVVLLDGFEPTVGLLVCC